MADFDQASLVAWDRTMQIGRGHGCISSMVFNTYRLSEAGEEYAQAPKELIFPSLTDSEAAVAAPTSTDDRAKAKDDEKKQRHSPPSCSSSPSLLS